MEQAMEMQKANGSVASVNQGLLIIEEEEEDD